MNAVKCTSAVAAFCNRFFRPVPRTFSQTAHCESVKINQTPFCSPPLRLPSPREDSQMPCAQLLAALSSPANRSGQPLFQSVNSAGTEATGRTLNRYNAWAAIRKRAKAAGFLTPVGCHTWRATGITIYLENDGRLEHAQQMAGHESPRTTKLYDRTKDEITLSEVERIRL
jgi:hypothetical protein